MSGIDAPADIAGLHPTSGDWARDMPWHWSKRHDHLETTYSRPGATGRTVRVFLNRNIIKNGAAAPWEIARQLRSAVAATRRAKSRRQRR